MSHMKFYRTWSYQSGTTWVKSEDGKVSIHVGYYDGEPIHPEASLMGTGLMEKQRLADGLCKCLNDAHEHLERIRNGVESSCPYIWGLTTATVEIYDCNLVFVDAHLGKNTCHNYSLNNGGTWTPVKFPDYFVEELKLVLEKIKKNSKDN